MSTPPVPAASGSHAHHPSSGDAARYRGQLLTGVAAILLGVIVSLLVLTGIRPSGAQWLLVLGALSVAVGLVGLLPRRRDRAAPPPPT